MSLIPGVVLSVGLSLAIAPLSIGGYLVLNLPLPAYLLFFPTLKYPPCASLNWRWVTAALLQPRLVLVANLGVISTAGVGWGVGLVPLQMFLLITFFMSFLHITQSLGAFFLWWRLTRNPPKLCFENKPLVG